MARIAPTFRPDLATLVAEHKALDQKVSKLNKRLYLTSAEQFEIRRLKKLKLAKKDLIANLLSREHAS